MSSRYTNALEPTSFNGVVNGINVRWSGQDPLKRLESNARDLGVKKELLKPLTEHFPVLVAKSTDNSSVLIM